MLFQVLSQHDILSAPLVVSPGLEDTVSEAAPVSYGPSLLGWIDINDILNAFITRKLTARWVRRLLIIHDACHTGYIRLSCAQHAGPIAHF